MSEPTPSRWLRGAAILRDTLVRELLEARLVGVLAVGEPDGAIHAIPLWFALDGDCVILATGSASHKVRLLERDPRATLVVHDSRPGAEVCGVTLRGRVDVVLGHDASPLVKLVHRRYVTEAGLQLAEVAAFLAGDDAALRFRLERASTWDERGSEAARALRERGAALPLERTSPR